MIKYGRTIEGISLGSFAAIPKGALTHHPKMGGGIPFRGA